MGDDAVIRLGYDNSKVRSGARETEATMQRTAQSVKGNWNETSKKLKDVFDPLSRGALVNAGGVGVAVFGATQSVRLFRSTVEDLAKAEYLSASQRDQMGHIARQFEEIDQYIGRIQAKAIAGAFNFMSGGDFDRAAQADAAGQSYQRQAGLIKQIAAMEKEAAEAEMTTAEKLQRRREEILEIDRQIEEERTKHFTTADQEAQSQERMLQLQKQGLDLKKQEVDLSKQAAVENQRAADAQAKLDEKNHQRAVKAGDTLSSMEELEARAGGRNRKADRIARERKVATRQRELMDQFGIPAAEAGAFAEREADLQDRISGKKRTIRGYSGKQRDRRARTIYDSSFNEFFHPMTSDVHHGQKSLYNQSFNELFHGRDIATPKNPPSGPRSQNGVKTTTRDPSHDDSRRLLERIAKGIEQIIAE